jgi:hypothetical protein
VIEVKQPAQTFGLLRYRHSPQRGTEVHRSSSPRKPVEDLTALINALGLKPSEVRTVWTGTNWEVADL